MQVAIVGIGQGPSNPLSFSNVGNFLMIVYLFIRDEAGFGSQ